MKYSIFDETGGSVVEVGLEFPISSSSEGDFVFPIGEE